MAEEVRLTEIRKELYSSTHLEYEPERLPNHNVRFCEHITSPHADSGLTYQTVATITVPTGKVLRVLYLRWWSKDGVGGNLTQELLEIRQTGAPVDASTSAPLWALVNGVIDVLTPDRVGPVRLENPIYILQGTVTFRILNVDATHEYSVTMEGDEFAPQPLEHYENLVKEE